MGFYLLTFFMVIPSPLLMFISSEAWIIFVGLTSDRNLVAVGLTLAAGQTVGFSLLYLFGDRVLARWPRLRDAVDRLDKDRLRKGALPALALSSGIGLPPHNVMALSCSFVGVRLRTLTAFTFVGRGIRYVLLGLAPYYFAQYVGTDWIPEWVKGWV